MADLQLSAAIHAYDRVKALYTGEVKADGIDLQLKDIPAYELFWRMLEKREFEACEMSMSYYLITKDRGVNDITAIPVFPSRVFRHSNIYINTRSGIVRPEDLRGKKIGLPEYQMTAMVWLRGIMQHEYGVNPEDVVWYRGGESVLKDKGEKMPLQLHKAGIEIQAIPADQTLDDMLEKGEIDALFSTRVPPGIQQGSPNVRRLFENYKSEEEKYYRKTGIFPIMHTFVVRTDFLQEHPWIAASLFDAFTRAKEIAIGKLKHPGRPVMTYPWAHADIEAIMDAGDPWQYGLEENRRTLETIVAYSHEQGLIKEAMPLEDLFFKAD